MCVAVPMKIEKILDNNYAEASVGEVSRKICISLIENPKVNDYVLIHAGMGIEKLKEEEALETLQLLNEMMSLNPD